MTGVRTGQTRASAESSARHADPGFFYERFADQYDAAVNPYGMERRLAVVFDELLPGACRSKRLLDAGCGTGWFSARACREGATVVSLDVGVRLLGHTARRCPSTAWLAVSATCRFPPTRSTW